MGRPLEEDEEDESAEVEEPEQKKVDAEGPALESETKFWLEEDDIGDF